MDVTSQASIAYRAVAELMTGLTWAANGEDVGRAMLTAGRAFGFSTSLVLDMRKLFDRVGQAIVFAAVGRDPIERFYSSDNPIQSLPLIVHARQTDMPFRMSSVAGAADRLPPHMRDMDGMVVPVHSGGALVWYCGFAGHEPEISPRSMAVMGAAAHAGFGRFCELLDFQSPRSPLTRRESECLRLVSEGKTDSEIGQLLDISPRTVRFHVDNAKMKLGVSTRVQAVAKHARGAASAG